MFVFSLLSADTEDVCIVERLFSSSLVAIVSLKAPRKLKVCHFKKGTEICNYSYSNTILAVKLNRQVGGAPAHRPGPGFPGGSGLRGCSSDLGGGRRASGRSRPLCSPHSPPGLRSARSSQQFCSDCSPPPAPFLMMPWLVPLALPIP